MSRKYTHVPSLWSLPPPYPHPTPVGHRRSWPCAKQQAGVPFASICHTRAGTAPCWASRWPGVPPCQNKSTLLWPLWFLASWRKYRRGHTHRDQRHTVCGVQTAVPRGPLRAWGSEGFSEEKSRVSDLIFPDTCALVRPTAWPAPCPDTHAHRFG